ncbi:MAG: HAD-IB family hydrolase, partial [Candidatus Dadabacteria bacterium]
MPLIIFDFDKTLIPVDTGFEYIRFMLRRSR